MGDPRCFPVDHAKLQPQGPRTDRDSLHGVRRAELGPPEDIDYVERARFPGRVGKRWVRGDSHDRTFIRIHRNAVEALLDQVAKYGVRLPAVIRRRSHDRDPVRGTQDVLDLGVVEDRDRTTTLGKIQERSCSIALVPTQVAASRSYGWPSAAGGMLRPTTPARMMMVTR